jgi:imidazolonepropionase-like amidohydrolase
MGERLAITGVTLVDGRGGDPLERAVVVVEDGTIAAAGAESEVPVDREARVLDAAGGVLMPGIIDAHCHLGGASHPDEDRWVLEDDRYQAIASAAQAREMLRHGVTSARDISVNGTRLRTAIDRGLISGPRIVPCWSSRAASASRCGPAAAGCMRTSRRTCSTTAWPSCA